MKKTILTFAIISFLGLMSYAQGNLQFSQVKIVSDVQESVPEGKVWKVTSVLGREIRLNECVDFSPTSTHEIGKFLLCSFSGWVPTDISSRFTYVIRKLKVNNIDVLAQVSSFKECAQNLWESTNCSGTVRSCSYMGAGSFSCANMVTDPNLLPMWLPSGTTLQSGGPNTYLTVIEFNVIP